MRTVRDGDGTTLVLLKESGDAALVRNPSTGEESYVPTTSIEPVDGKSPLLAAARSLPEPRDPPLESIVDPRALGLLVHLDANGPQSVTALLEIGELCESDLHGATGELRAAGLVEETTVGGVRGYEATEKARNALEA